jgi:cell pole-organizing protein PopZ
MPEADTIPAAPPKATAPSSDPATDGLLSSPAAQASRNAFAALGQMQVRVEEGAPNTLDGLVADLLKPMLREWLDRELPSLVERLVSAEVARLSGRG